MFVDFLWLWPFKKTSFFHCFSPCPAASPLPFPDPPSISAPRRVPPDVPAAFEAPAGPLRGRRSRSLQALLDHGFWRVQPWKIHKNPEFMGNFRRFSMDFNDFTKIEWGKKCKTFGFHGGLFFFNFTVMRIWMNIIEYKIYPTMCFPKVQSSTSWDLMGYEWVKADRGCFSFLRMIWENHSYPLDFDVAC